jgi:hypothetical protein
LAKTTKAGLLMAMMLLWVSLTKPWVSLTDKMTPLIIAADSQAEQ